MRVPRPNKHGLPAGLRRDATGALLIDVWYRDASGKKKRLREMLGNVPLKMAVDVLAKRRVEILGGKLGGGMAERVTLKEAFDRYLEWAKVERPRSMRFRNVAAVRLCAAYGKVTLAEITPWHLERYKRDARKRRGLAPATVDLDVAAFKHMIGRAASWGLISREKAHEIRDEVKLLRVPNERVRFLTVEEKGRLLAACGPDLCEIVVAAINLGARSGELRAMTWDQVDLDGRTVIVRRTKGRKPTFERIHVNDDLLAAIRNAEARRKKRANVWTTKAGRAWRPSWLQEQFGLALRRAGLEDFRFHDLRHHFASTLVQRGIGLRRVQKLLGHARITTTERYAHLAPDVDLATDVLREGGEVRYLEGQLKQAKADGEKT